MKNNFFYKKEFSNIYRKASKKSEIISQILYGEKFKVLSENKKWLKIKTSFDNYVGYIKNKNYVSNHNPTHKVFVLKTPIYNNQVKQKKKLPFGSKISIINQNKNFIEFEKKNGLKKKMSKRLDIKK